MSEQISETNSGQAFETLRRLIVNGTLAPGRFITQKELLEYVGVSLGPVRTALAQLEAEGYVQVVPQKGIQIVKPTLELLRNVTQVRIALEKEAWIRFAFGGNEKVLEDIIERHLWFQSEWKAGRLTDAFFENVSQFDHDMHFNIINLLGNDFYTKVFRISFEMTNLIKPDHGRSSEQTINNTLNEHLAILYACRQREKQAIGEAVEGHLMSSVRRFMAF